MRVLMVSNLWPPEVVGGAEQYAAALAERLRAAGHEVDVVTLGVDGPDVVGTVPPWPYPIQETGSQPAARRLLFHAADLYNPRARATLDRVLAEFRPDVVHTHVVQGLSSVALTRPESPRASRTSTRCTTTGCCASATRWCTATVSACETRCRSCRRSRGIRNEAIQRSPPDVVLAVSQAIAREHEELPWTADRLRVLYNPVSIVARDRAAAARRRLAADVRLPRPARRDKGIATLLDAFARADLADAPLVVAGRGDLEDAVRAAARRRVRAGWVSADEKEALLDDVDCLVVPSRVEGPGAARGERGAGPRHPGDRRARSAASRS